MYTEPLALELEKHISDLLFEHDCIVIPGFGGFVANYAPASVHPTLHTLQPPFKKITFNNRLTNNDGLLANHIAAFERSSFREANKYIGEQVNKINSQLKTGQRVSLSHIGDLYLDPEQNIRFDQDLNTNYYLGSFGLGSLQATPVVRDRYEREKAFVNRTHEEVKKPVVRKMIPYAVAATFLLLFGVTIGVSIFSPNTINLAKLVDFGVGIEATYELREDVVGETESVNPENIAFYTFDLPEEQSTLTYSFNDNVPKEGGIIVKVKDSSTENPKEETPATEILKVEAADLRNYHIIAGAFRNRKNADKLVMKLRSKGYNSLVLEEGYSLNKVSYGGFVQKEEAVEELSRIQQMLNPNAWIYKKH